MQRILKPPHEINIRHAAVFLAGSIEMGAAEDWQEKATKLLSDTDLDIWNPRRDDWDSSWEQRYSNQQFREQVEWELHALEHSKFILMYFAPGTKSPISLLELGLHARSQKMFVVCPDGFWRKGNVEVVCAKYGMTLFSSIEEAVDAIKKCV